jgi:hypothetical protein
MSTIIQIAICLLLIVLALLAYGNRGKRLKPW